MTLLDRTRPRADTDLETDALFEEARARQRQRRRQLRRAAALLLLGLLALASLLVARDLSALHPATRSGGASSPTRRLGPVVSPKAPESLALDPHGSVHLVDTGRAEILRYSPHGHFRVVAGDGKRGRSPDGTLATTARLRLSHASGIAVSPRGAVYFVDVGNGLVRAVLPNGRLSTVAGGGTKALGRATAPARAVRFASFTGLAFGPGHALYLATSKGTYRLGARGHLHWVLVGNHGPPPPRALGWRVREPAWPGDFTSAARLAYDTRGDLFVAGGGGWGLYERTASGRLRFVEVLRGKGAVDRVDHQRYYG